MRCEGDVHSGDAPTNKNSTKGRGDVLGHGAEVRKGETNGREGGREGGFANPVRTELQSGSL